MRYGSVCSGIEAATVAWDPLGFEPAWFSEIEKFPSAVLAHHYPKTPNLGDMTTIKERITKNGKAIDLLVGGTPCQSFSVAGLRKGMDDPRGNLALVFLGILDHLRPRWMVWENVPGVLSSSRRRDFGAFLGALEKLGYGFAYRVLDAQNFGVPQRRRRVFVVGYFGDWRPAAAVLFERESLSGDPAPSREKRQRIAPGVACGPPFSRTGNERVETEAIVLDRASFNQGQNAHFDPQITQDGSVPSLVARGPHAVQPVAFHNRQDPDVSGDKTHPIGAKDNGMAVGVDVYNHKIDGDVSATVTEAAGGTNTSGPKIMGGMQVRRLTPRECERLQGFPDDYTLIPYRGGYSADGPRYKALGNSMAVPVMRWIGERIKMFEENK